MGMGMRTPGPIHLFSRFRSATTVYYMGTAIAGPEPEHEKYRIPVFNDIGGRSVPFQVIKDGEDALIVFSTNRFDYNVMQTIRGLDSSNAGPAAPLVGNLNAGSELSFTRGSMVLGITDFQLITLNEYATVGIPAVGNVADLPPARIYFSCEMLKYKESTQGTRVLDIAAIIKATSIYNYAAYAFAGGNGLAGGGLYSEDPTRVGITSAALMALVLAAGG